jgi:hypothetical protein
MVMLLLSHPLGKLFAFCLPITVYRLPARLPLVGGVTFSLNPGPWNIKEHVLVFMMANVSLNTPYAMNAIVVGEFNYGYKTDYWFGLILVLATQLTGFGIAGLCRRFLVWPASMIWPQNLVVCTLLNTLHAEDDEGTSGMSRYRFFMYVSVAAFFWTFMPGEPSTSMQAIARFLTLGSSRLSLHGPLELFVHLLDGAQVGSHQPVVRDRQRPGDELPYVRLEPDLVDRLAPHHPVVGATARLQLLRHILLDRRPDPLLHEHVAVRALPDHIVVPVRQVRRGVQRLAGGDGQQVRRGRVRRVQPAVPRGVVRDDVHARVRAVDGGDRACRAPPRPEPAERDEADPAREGRHPREADAELPGGAGLVVLPLIRRVLRLCGHRVRGLAHRRSRLGAPARHSGAVHLHPPGGLHLRDDESRGTRSLPVMCVCARELTVHFSVHRLPSTCSHK